MNVTKEIRQNHITYGASDNTAPNRTAAGRSLNYAAGPSIMRPDKTNVTVIPRTLKYNSTIGLFGAENYFVRVNLHIQDNAAGTCFEEIYWECAIVQFDSESFDQAPTYAQAEIDLNNFATDNTYVDADINDSYLPFVGSTPFVSVDLNNLKTGNMYVDNWLDVRLYTSDREEHPYDKMYVSANGFFYIGIHARNPRRLPFDVECLIGTEYRSYESIEDRRLIMNRRESGPHY